MRNALFPMRWYDLNRYFDNQLMWPINCGKIEYILVTIHETANSSLQKLVSILKSVKWHVKTNAVTAVDSINKAWVRCLSFILWNTPLILDPDEICESPSTSFRFCCIHGVQRRPSFHFTDIFKDLFDLPIHNSEDKWVGRFVNHLLHICLHETIFRLPSIWY